MHQAVWLVLYNNYSQSQRLYRTPIPLPRYTTGTKACVKQVIQFINAGKITMRLKGGTKKDIIDSMSQERKRSATLVMQEGIRVKAKFKAVALDNYERDNPGFNRGEALIRMLNLPGQNTMGGTNTCYQFIAGAGHVEYLYTSQDTRHWVLALSNPCNFITVTYN